MNRRQRDNLLYLTGWVVLSAAMAYSIIKILIMIL